MSPLQLLPTEILSTVAIFLACNDPYSPPRDLLALQATSHYFNSHLNCHLNPAVWTAAFRFRFDHLAVLRRNFRPNGRDYFDQLRQYTEDLAIIRRRDISGLSDLELDDLMRTVYVLLLDNNGKNRSQLEHVDVNAFLLHYLETRVWERAQEVNDGWPVDTPANAFMVWAMWMLTTPQKLEQETIQQREQIVMLLLPFVINPYRYAQAEAPPSHFHLPLQQGFVVPPASTASAHGPYPVYVDPNRESYHAYFGSMAPFSPPPITAAAKLLYFARREIIPFNIPTHIPRTRAEAPPSDEPRPVQEDFIEINAHRGARPPPCVTWDWDQGLKLVNGIHDDSDVDYSACWDPDYWRRRLCGDAWRPNPKWRPDNVYVPGCMDGLWQGRLVFPMEASMMEILGKATYPAHQNFNETMLHVTHQPLFMRLKEMHAVSTSHSTSDLHLPFPPTHPPPQNNDDLTDWSDLSMRNAWFPGNLGSVKFNSSYDPVPNSRLYTPNGTQKNVLVKLDGHAPPTGAYPASPYTHEDNAWLYKEFDRKLDKEKRNAAEMEGEDGYRHEGWEHCEKCRERDETVRRARALDERDHESISETYAREWRTIEKLFENVGLGRDEMHPDDDMYDDSETDDEDIAVDEDEEQPEFILDLNSEVTSSPNRPVRRGTDREKIVKCDGIQDIIFRGGTDRRHALAWNRFTFYGRVRPWDGLIGILRRSYWPRQNFIFFYGYLIGNESFVGNWRFAAHDPNTPCWESAFIMSRRKDEDVENGGSGGSEEVLDDGRGDW